MLIVAASSGSSPGRAGYKMAVAEDGELIGSIGGGVMEVELVERARAMLNGLAEPAEQIIEQVHRRNAENASGMICSGRQTVILKILTPDDLETVKAIARACSAGHSAAFQISNDGFTLIDSPVNGERMHFSEPGEYESVYQEAIGKPNRLVVIGGGHCALALSELASRLDFHISIFDDRPELNTIAKNEFADEVTIVDSYDDIAAHVPSGDNVYAVVMTLGYVSDSVVIRNLIDHSFAFFGVLGSRAKMRTLLKDLEDKGLSPEKLSAIRTPVGLPINSHTPEEIAVSIAAEMIAVKNGART